MVAQDRLAFRCQTSRMGNGGFVRRFAHQSSFHASIPKSGHGRSRQGYPGLCNGAIGLPEQNGTTDHGKAGGGLVELLIRGLGSCLGDPNPDLSQDFVFFQSRGIKSRKKLTGRYFPTPIWSLGNHDCFVGQDDRGPVRSGIGMGKPFGGIDGRTNRRGV